MPYSPVVQPPSTGEQLDSQVAAPLQFKTQEEAQDVILQEAAPLHVRLQPPPGQSSVQLVELQVIWHPPPTQLLAQLSPVQSNWQPL